MHYKWIKILKTFEPIRNYFLDDTEADIEADIIPDAEPEADADDDDEDDADEIGEPGELRSSLVKVITDILLITVFD